MLVKRFGATLGLASDEIRAVSLSLHELLKSSDYLLDDIPRIYRLLHSTTENGMATLHKVTTLPLKAKEVGINTAAELSELLEFVKVSSGCKFAGLEPLPSIWQRLDLFLFPRAYANEKCRSLSGLVEGIIDSAKSFGIKTPAGMKVFAKIDGAIETPPSTLKVQRIREGSDASKVAVVGRSMGNAEEGLVGVRDAASHLKSKGITPSTFEPSPAANSSWEKAVERYRQEVGSPNAYLPDDIVRTTDLYKENVSWVNKLKEDGFTVLDIGNPNSLSSTSIFYEMEKSILF